ncbi:MAG: hypothetical protein FWF10_10420 [Clostridiales bacterium]|nr:hypothetical protein [Clostridiales bacterium]
MAESHPKKKRFKARFFLLLIVLIGLLVAGIVYLAKNPTTGRLGFSTVVFELETNAVIIRNEMAIKPDDYARIQFTVDEGALISDHQPIAELFSRRYESTYDQLLRKEIDIYRLMTEQALVEETGVLTALNDQINEAVETLSAIASGKTEGDYLATARELERMTVLRWDLLRQAVAQPSEELQTAIAELEVMRQQQTPWLNTAGSGYISFIVDGFENSLVVDQISASQINQFLGSTGLASFATENIYRIVSPDRWLFAITLPASAPQRLVNEQTYPLSADGVNYQAKVIKEIVAANYVAYILEVYGEVFPYLSVRATRVKIQTSESGVSIPVDGLTYVNGIPTIYIWAQDGNYYPLPVKILAADEKTAIIIALNPNVILTRGYRFSYQFPNPTEKPGETAYSLASDTPKPTPSLTPTPPGLPEETPTPTESADPSGAAP